jgi:hypothetical protein
MEVWLKEYVFSTLIKSMKFLLVFILTASSCFFTKQDTNKRNIFCKIKIQE